MSLWFYDIKSYYVAFSHRLVYILSVEPIDKVQLLNKKLEVSNKDIFKMPLSNGFPLLCVIQNQTTSQRQNLPMQ